MEQCFSVCFVVFLYVVLCCLVWGGVVCLVWCGVVFSRVLFSRVVLLLFVLRWICDVMCTFVM